MTAEKAWDYAIGMIKVDGLEPTEDFKKYIELENPVRLLQKISRNI